MPSARIRKLDSSKPRYSVHPTVDCHCATPFVVLPTKSKNPIALCHFKPSTRRSNGGKENPHQKHHLSVPHGLSAQTSKSNYENSFANGIFAFSTTKFLAIHHPSKRCLSNTLRYLTNCATTNRRFSTGPQVNPHSVVVNNGPSTEPRP